MASTSGGCGSRCTERRWDHWWGTDRAGVAAGGGTGWEEWEGARECCCGAAVGGGGGKIRGGDGDGDKVPGAGGKGSRSVPMEWGGRKDGASGGAGVVFHDGDM